MLTMYKQFLVFVLLRNMLTDYGRQVFVKTLMPLSKFYIILTFALALLSQFVDLEMTSGERYGMKAFYFVFENHSAFGISVIASFLIISASTLTKKKFVFYLILSIVSLLLTTKGVIFSFISFTIIIFFISQRATIKIWHTAALTSSLLLISTYQISTYYLDDNSPRMRFLQSSIMVAHDYAPLGSGFATFGGKQAQQHYSPLYVKYGFTQVYGMGKGDGLFLNDNYLAMILAQTGYLGTVVYLIILFLIFHILNKDRHTPIRYKTAAMATLLMLVVSSIATGIIKSTNGVFLFALLSILSSSDQYFKRHHYDEQSSRRP